jgi:hypothetical protein
MLRTVNPGVTARRHSRSEPACSHPAADLRLPLLSALAAIALGSPVAATAQSFGEIVRSFCLTAFETEMAEAGKTPPAGMADYACSCVADRLRQGQSVGEARSSCRQATAQRYRI